MAQENGLGSLRTGRNDIDWRLRQLLDALQIAACILWQMVGVSGQVVIASGQNVGFIGKTVNSQMPVGSAHSVGSPGQVVEATAPRTEQQVSAKG